jgi:hypothetical protein
VLNVPLKFPVVAWMGMESGVLLIVTVTVSGLLASTVLAAFATCPETVMLACPYEMDVDAGSELKTAVALTVCVNAVEVLVEKPEPPLYTAVMEWDPAARVEVVSVATPEPLSVTALPRAVDPSLNVTEPVGV